MNRKFGLVVALAYVLVPVSAWAVPVTFSSAVSTFDQTSFGFWPASQMIDGITSGVNGWAIYRNSGVGDQTLSETALFTLTSPLAAGPESLTFTIYQNFGNFHLLGDFNFGYTTAGSPTLGSAETQATITGANSLNGTTFSFSPGGPILAGGPLPNTDIYTVTASVNSGTPITGFFLNVINDPSNGLPTGGPGRQPTNGNFVVSELTLGATVGRTGVPEPSTLALFGAGIIGLGALRRRKVRKNA